MKPRKAKSSTPAGIPHLQELGFTISYQNVVVTEAKLDKLKKMNTMMEAFLLLDIF